MNNVLLGLLAETMVHPGSGQSVGVVDLPVARETTTGYPIIVGSGMKGSLRDKARRLENSTGKEDSEKIIRLFGGNNAVGKVSVTDARMLLLPIRSLTSHFRWVTCPYILERFQRDLNRFGFALQWSPLPEVKGQQALVCQGEGTVFLEELTFEQEPTPSLNEVVNNIQLLIKHQSVKDNLAKQIMIISNDEFYYFAQNGLCVNARNVLDVDKKSDNLWYEEAIPSESIFYAALYGQDKEALNTVISWFEHEPYLQLGGNETIGQGWFSVVCIPASRGEKQ